MNHTEALQYQIEPSPRSLPPRLTAVRTKGLYGQSSAHRFSAADPLRRGWVVYIFVERHYDGRPSEAREEGPLFTFKLRS